jgi:hypothetical protein
MDAEKNKDCDICLSTLPAQSILLWDCKQCNWCFECITDGITSSPQKSDWPQNWCGHDDPTAISLKGILQKANKHIPPNVYTKWFENLEQRSQIKCPHCCRWTHSDHITEARILDCPTCRKSVCLECSKLAHEGQCKRTKKEDLKAVLNALRHEGTAMCPRCGLVAGREKDGCNQITCPKPCSQAFCFKCSRDWKLCKGMCKVGATEVLERAAQEDNLDSPILKEDKSKDWALKVEDKEDEDEEIEDKAAKRKRAPSPDPLFERFTKKAKPEIIEEEKDEHGTEVIFDISDGEDVNAHDDEDDEAGFDIEEGEYGSDDGEEDGDDELEDDFEE